MGAPFARLEVRESSGGCGLFGAHRHRLDRLQDLRGNLVGVALRVGTAIFQITLVAVVDEGVRHADRSAAVGNAVARSIGIRMTDLPLSPPRLSAAIDAATPRMAAE